ncbi:MFS transporter, UMF1 family [Tranquillimonas rosea]|uniref:MFS transporter, UMF1 family n=1 Tax=Tranquillimonas rosea TaxID=641238 RepID=A0A1H9U9Y4_9RHOB|nr:MFS transporter [Tranquillimonas rosea]SES06370.1 MFS transporter, UMF1 family [Tranquillimonas rosea]
MADAARKRIWGWMAFDWASQPYNTLLLTFIFAPYFATVVGDGAQAQVLWGTALTVSGLTIAVLAPILGALADTAGRRMPWIVLFSALYVVGASGLWWAVPEAQNVTLVLAAFGIGLIGMEFATIFTNALLPTLGPRSALGGISGTGWAVGYSGGVVSLVIMLLFLAENYAGLTFLGRPPAFGLDPDAREGTRAVGPLVALWYLVFMVPFFIWVREDATRALPRVPVRQSLRALGTTIRRLPEDPSLAAYLGSSMLYRDALNGMYTFGGIYAFGVLGWSVVDIGVFGIIAAVSGAIFAWLGGKADDRFGPKPVIAASIWMLTGVGVVIVTLSETAVLGIPVAPGSPVPDIAFYICGGVIGGAGGALQSASRTMMVRQANPARMTEGFGLYALAGKATSFLAPALIALATDLTGSQRLGVSPLIILFAAGLVLLRWVKPNGGRAAQWSHASSSA